MEVDMPLAFVFCLRNTNTTLENEKYQKTGYNSIYRFFSGTSMFDETLVGWLGHMKNGSTYDSLDGKCTYVCRYVFLQIEACTKNLYNINHLKTVQRNPIRLII